MKLMRVIDWQIIRLAIMTGVVLGLATTVSLELIDADKVLRWWWQAAEEVLGVGLGVTFTFGKAEDIKRWTGYQTAGRYVSFLLMVLIVWCLWLTLIMMLSEHAQALRLMGIGDKNGMGNGVGWVKSLIESIKLTGLGLLPVVGFKLLTKKQKDIKT